MKTVVIVHQTGIWGGGTKSLLDLCEMLRDKNNVIVCIPCGYPDFHEKVLQYGCKVHEFDTPIPYTNIYSGRPPLISISMLKSFLSLFWIKRFGDELLALKPDVVIFNTLVTAISSVYLHKYTKTICIDRETLTSGISKVFYRKLLDKSLNVITFLSEYERKKLDFRVCESFVFPDCIRLDSLVNTNSSIIREKMRIPDDKYVILYMGGLAKIKGTDVILEAMDILDENFLLIFAGDMNENKLSRKQLLHDLKYPSYFFFKKRVRDFYYKLKGTEKLFVVGLQNSVDELIVASDVVVFPSTSVHQPRPCIEAGAYRKPVILSDYKETSEYFQNEYNALTFKPRDANDLTKKLLFAFSHFDVMSSMGENNRTMTEKMHDYFLCKDTICSIIERVCGDAN